MALKDNWIDRQNEIDDVDSEDINKVAHAVIELEENANKNVVDQTYSSTSENAQSGKAVAEAVAIEQKRSDNTFANALKGTKSGAIVSANDVSPVEHNLGVKLTSKNLYAPTLQNFNGNGITAVKNNDNTYTINGTASKNIYISVGEVLPCEKGKTYYFSGGTANIFIAYQLRNNGLGVMSITVNDRVQSGNATNWNEVNVVIEITKGTVADNVIIKPMISLFDNTPYTPYIPDLTAVKVIKSNASGEAVAEYTPTADGTVEGVTSLYPNTTLMTDTEGVIIDCEYNRDINKAFAALEAAIVTNNS